MNKIVFDIETKGALEDWQEQELYDSIKPNGRLKDPAKIQIDIKEKFEAKIERAALDPWMGRVRVITACNLSADKGKDLAPVASWASDDDEGMILSGFRDWLMQMPGGYRVIGFNIGRFDIRFLNVRMLKHGIPWRSPFPAHQRDYKRYFDLMTVFEEHKLDHWLRLMGFPAKLADGKDTLNMSIKDTLEYAVQEMVGMSNLVRRMGECLNILELQI